MSERKIIAGYIAGLIHGYISKTKDLSEEEIQTLSAAEVLLAKKSKSEALLKRIK